MSIQTIIFLLIVGFFMGFTTCFILGMLIFDKPDGELMIDQTRPEKDLYTMQFSTPLEKLPKRKKVRFKVKTIKRSAPIDEVAEARRLLKELEDSQDLQRSI